MLTLAVDTSSAVGSVALIQDGQLIADATTNSVSASPRAKRATHSTNLVPAIEKLISDLRFELSDCDLFAVGLGPGSFTGIRVAIATAKGFALALKKPIVGVSSMDALALASKERMPADCSSLAVVVDAGRGEIYCSVYSVLEGQFFKVNDAAIVRIGELGARILTPTFFVGPEIERFAQPLEAALPKLARLDAKPAHTAAPIVGLLAEERFSEQRMGDADLEPIYLRAPAAKPADPKFPTI